MHTRINLRSGGSVVLLQPRALETLLVLVMRLSFWMRRPLAMLHDGSETGFGWSLLYQ
jgi:hypothetical protein